MTQIVLTDWSLNLRHDETPKPAVATVTVEFEGSPVTLQLPIGPSSIHDERLLPEVEKAVRKFAALLSSAPVVVPPERK